MQETDEEIEKFERNVAFQEHKYLWLGAGGVFFVGFLLGDVSARLSAVLMGLAGLMVIGSGVKAIVARRSALRMGGGAGTVLINHRPERGPDGSKGERHHAYWTGGATIVLGIAFLALAVEMAVK